MRVFFTNLRRDGTAPADINRLDAAVMPHAADRSYFDGVVGYEAEDLTYDEIDELRPRVYQYQAAEAKQPFFCKVHDAYTFLPNGQPLFPPEATAGAVYLIRNPLDVCGSYAHHVGVSRRDAIIDSMADPRYTTAAGDECADPQLRQRFLTWSQHVLSWVDAPNLRTHVVRYEDMHARPMETFAAAAAFVGMTQDQARIRRALQFSSLTELQRQEAAHGFQEAATNRSFFRKGQVGAWREELTPAQVSRIIRDHRDVMYRFGYLTEAGDPIVPEPEGTPCPLYEQQHCIGPSHLGETEKTP